MRSRISDVDTPGVRRVGMNLPISGHKSTIRQIQLEQTL